MLLPVLDPANPRLFSSQTSRETNSKDEKIREEEATEFKEVECDGWM